MNTPNRPTLLKLSAQPTGTPARDHPKPERLIHGNPGLHRNLTHGVSELKIDVGPGYRVYYVQHGERLLLLLAGGDKSTQRQDIARAIALAQTYGE